MGEPLRIGEFVVESLLGEGGMGVVYRARQVALDRWVALKVLPRARENQSFVDRFHREAKAAACLVHPNIVQIHTVGEDQGMVYFAMEYVEGEDIDHLLRPGAGDPFSVEESVEIVRSVAKALVLAGEHGIVHRDIKPANIMVTRSGLVKVMDFGLAKASSSDHALTQQGLIVGTPAYMSPEQGASRAVDGRSDQYSLGCVLYECLSGQAPFTADNVASLIFKHMYDQPQPLSAKRPEVPAEVEQICARMMAKNPDERFPNPLDLLEALAKLPVNSNAAEVSLAKRVMALMQQKKAKTADFNRNLPSTNLMNAGEPASTVVPVVPGAPPPVFAAWLKASPAAGTAASPAAPAPLPGPPVPAFPKAAAPDPLAAKVAPAGAAFIALPPAEAARAEPPVNAAFSAVPGPAAAPPPLSLPPAAAAVPMAASAVRVNEIFQKLPDGRWSYKAALGRCSLTEGLACEDPAPAGGKTEGLGDCLLCANWNKRLGCAMAYGQSLEAQGRYRGLRLCSEQAIAWTGAGRFDKAIALLDGYMRSNPDDPEGYRELARVYDRPEYRGKDKRRAIVLYSRFLELARQTGGFSHAETARAEERMAALRALPPDHKSSAAHDAGLPFQAFYRGLSLCFCYGSLTRERIVLVRAGDVDPESGVQAAELGGAMNMASSLFRRFRSEKAKRDELAAVKKELLRLAGIPSESLPMDPACVAALSYGQMLGVSLTVDPAVNIRCVKITMPEQAHELFFTEAGAFRAEQCHALIRRKVSRSSGPVT